MRHLAVLIMAFGMILLLTWDVQAEHFNVPSDGTPILTSAFDPKEEHALILSGKLFCSLDDGIYDAASTIGKDQKPFLIIDPPLDAPEPLGQNRWRYKIPTNFSSDKISLRINRTALIRDYIVRGGFTPAEIEKCLEGLDLNYELSLPPGASFPWLSIGIPVAILFLGTGWIIRRRQSLMQHQDIDTLLRRIKQKERALLASLPKDELTLNPVKTQVPLLTAGTMKLAPELKALRTRIQSIDRIAIETQIKKLTDEHAMQASGDVRNDLEETLLEKQKVLSALEENRQLERKMFLRLERTESILDAIKLKVPQMLLENSSIDSASEEIHREMHLLEETLKEIKHIEITATASLPRSS